MYDPIHKFYSIFNIFLGTIWKTQMYFKVPFGLRASGTEHLRSCVISIRTFRLSIGPKNGSPQIDESMNLKHPQLLTTFIYL